MNQGQLSWLFGDVAQDRQPSPADPDLAGPHLKMIEGCFHEMKPQLNEYELELMEHAFRKLRGLFETKSKEGPLDRFIVAKWLELKMIEKLDSPES